MGSYLGSCLALSTAALLAVLAPLSSCGSQPDLVVYCALDQEFAEPLIRRFEAETGLDVRAEFDVEASKTVGLVRRIEEEAGRPRCDVFWNNEVAHTVRLAEAGRLAAYRSPSAEAIPPLFRDPEDRWTGFAARARILIVNTDLVAPASVTSMWDIVDPRFAGRACIARPLTGTTLTHLAALHTVLGEQEAGRYVARLRELGGSGALSLTNGNATNARLVRDGQMAIGWTDTDDYQVAVRAGKPVAAVYPDQQSVGTLLIPNSIAILAGAPHQDAARRFVDWVLRPETEAELALSDSAQIPVREAVPRPAHVRGPGDFRVMQVDYRAVGREIGARADRFREVFLQ
jgi:iron(III) transport system substrate-binding protein